MYNKSVFCHPDRDITDHIYSYMVDIQKIKSSEFDPRIAYSIFINYGMNVRGSFISVSLIYFTNPLSSYKRSGFENSLCMVSKSLCSNAVEKLYIT
mgnify:CR=1 FL=1